MKRIYPILSLLLAVLLVLGIGQPAFAAETVDPKGTITELFDVISSYSLYYHGESCDALMIAAAKDYFEEDTASRAQICSELNVSTWDELAALMAKDSAAVTRFGEELMKLFTEKPKVMEAFLDTMMQQQDKHSHFMFPDDYEVSYSMSDDYVGIGITINSDNPYVCSVETVFAGSPAEEAGILPGDVIISVDGVNMEGQHYSEFTLRIRGEENTDVSLQVRRGDKLLNFTITRKRITISDISYAEYDGIAYIRITHFNNIQTFSDFITAFNTAKDNGCTAIIYDLRDNLGGNVEVLYNLLQYAVGVGGREIFSLADRDAEPEHYYSSGLGGYTPNASVVLINENTASASEMFAGAMKYSGGAVLVGSTSYGKGVGQYHLSLSDDSIAVVTNFEILLPGNIHYNNQGLTPDLAIEPFVIQFPDYDTLPVLGSAALWKGEVSANVAALEERLSILGFFTQTPDAVFDDATLAAVNRFQDYAGLSVCNNADTETLNALDHYFSEYSGSEAAIDRQLDAAIAYLLAAAHLPLGVVRVVAE